LIVRGYLHPVSASVGFIIRLSLLPTAKQNPYPLEHQRSHYRRHQSKMTAGVSKADIVLGFRQLKIRQHTGFAVA
jgi:hypothetical protein